jgi:hypothetical protein
MEGVARSIVALEPCGKWSQRPGRRYRYLRTYGFLRSRISLKEPIDGAMLPSSNSYHIFYSTRVTTLVRIINQIDSSLTIVGRLCNIIFVNISGRRRTPDLLRQETFPEVFPSWTSAHGNAQALGLSARTLTTSWFARCVF